ncbi:hypothetical protein D3C87_1555800 [compost metagenome]
MLALAFQVRFQLRRRIEMVFNGALITAGHKNKVGNPGGHGLFDSVLNERFVDHGQHFLGHRLGGGQETRAHASDWEDGFTDGTH